MDVWFDSGSSWAGVLQATPGLTYPADLYLEGSDQHRGGGRGRVFDVCVCVWRGGICQRWGVQQLQACGKWQQYSACSVAHAHVSDIGICLPLLLPAAASACRLPQAGSRAAC